MKVETSRYLQKIKPRLQKFLAELLEEYEYVSILAEDSESGQYSVSKTGTGMKERETLCHRGVVVKVYDKKGYSEYAFNRVTEEEMERAAVMLREQLVPMAGKLPDGIEAGAYPMPEDAPCVFHESTSLRTDPRELGDERIIEFPTGLSRKGMAVDERVINCAAMLNYQKYSKLFLSRNRDMLQDVMWTNGAVNTFASRGERVEYGYRGFSVLGGAELMEEMENGVEEVAKATLERLESEPMVPGEYDCICTPEVTGMIAHEAFGHGVEMDMFVKDRALAAEYIGKQVASELVTMHDGAAAVNETATYFFDDEGVPAQDTLVIDRGILKRGISDSQSALALGVKPTGNGRRESFGHKAYTRMTNTFFEGGHDKYEDMVASISYGFQLEMPLSGMEDPKNWGIQCMVTAAREIKDGRFTGKIYSPIVLTGYVPDLLKSISMVSETPRLCGSGFCGKGYKEWVKVSDGGPYIKARIRLG